MIYDMKVIKFELIRFVSQHEGKPRRIAQRATIDPVETDTVVEAQQTEHRQEETHPETYASAELEGIVRFVVIPPVGCFEEGQTIDRTAGVRRKGIPQFQGILIKHGEELRGLLLVRVDLGVGVLINGITALRNDIISQQTEVVGQTGVAHLEAFEGGEVQPAVVAAHEPVFRRDLQHELPRFVGAHSVADR